MINERKNSALIVIDSESLMRDVGPLYHTEELQLTSNLDSNTALVKNYNFNFVYFCFNLNKNGFRPISKTASACMFIYAIVLKLIESY